MFAVNIDIGLVVAAAQGNIDRYGAAIEVPAACSQRLVYAHRQLLNEQ